MSALKNVGASREGEPDAASIGVYPVEGRARSRRFPELLRIARRAATIAVAVGLGAMAIQGRAQTVTVGEHGTPSYAMSIALPPGIGGMKPNLGLAFSASSLNGPVGVGWSIEGISSITRCEYTKAVDGYAHGVDNGPNDKLCLDGQRLIQTDANGVAVNGGNTSPSFANPFQTGDSLGFTDGSTREYRTEKNTFARIRAYGAAGGVANNGPAYFVVWTKSGQVYEYATHSNASSNATITTAGGVVVVWAASRISDTLGNYIDFQYTQRDLAKGSGPATGATPGHEWNLSEIRYTGHGAQEPTNKVVLEYADRPATPLGDLSESYHLGNKNVSVALLKAIRTYVNWPASQTAQPATAVKVRTIKLAYDQGAIAHRSRVHTLTECVGPSEAKCLPATTFNYAAGGTDEYRAQPAFNLANVQLENTAGTMGAILGDFNGDGRTDLIRWSDTPGQNQLWTSNGDGTFAQASFSITADNLYKSDGCYTSYAMDLNGDGMTDLLRVLQAKATSGASCPAGSNYVFVSNGNGTFTRSTLPTNISLAQVLAVQTTTEHCGAPPSRPKPSAVAPAGLAAPAPAANATHPSSCIKWYTYDQTAGANFHLLDVNGDGLMDIVTSITPAYSNQDTLPDPDDGCSAIACSHVYVRNASTGSYDEITTTNLAHHSVYGAVGQAAKTPSTFFRPYVFDADGDGLSDITVATGTWRSNGDGNFTHAGTTAYGCSNPLDFNGDGRADCLYAYTTTAPWLTIADGATNYVFAGAFNLGAAGSGNELVGTGIGTMQLDVNGDGRTDILRWEDTASANRLYLSNGDGSFTASTTFKFNAAGTPIQLRKSDGSADLLAGDFTGHGTIEFIRVLATLTSGEAGTNQLYAKFDATPPDQLQSATSGSGLRTDLTWVTLANSASGSLGARYASDRGTANAAVAPMFDLTMPAWVVATATSDTGVGSSRVATDYWYAGLKGSFDGRGLAGFRETRRQSPGANGNMLTIDAQYLALYPYTGMASKTETWSGTLDQASPVRLNRATSVYCEQSLAGNAASATSTAPCAPSSPNLLAKVQAPYLYSSFEESWELGSGTTLPTVKTVNTFDGSGNPLTSVSTTNGMAFGVNQSFTKTTTNTYFADNTAGNSWILGRLRDTTQENHVPHSLPSITTSAGTGKFATATQGALVDASLSTPAFANTEVGLTTTGVATLTNTGGAVVNITTPPSAASITGTDFGFVSTTCGTSIGVSGSCTVTVKFAPTAAVARSGQLTIQTDIGARAAALSGTGIAQAALTLTNCSSVTPTATPTAATFSCTLGNTGPSAATSVAYGAGASSASGPTSCAASTPSCGVVTVTTSTAVGTYAGTLTATPNLGGAASAAFNLRVNTNGALALSGCSQTATTTPTPATFSCTLSNGGQTAVNSVSFSSTIAGVTISGPTGACGAGATCGTVTLTSPAAAATYSGTLTATPSNGSAASTSIIGLRVRTQAAIWLSCGTANNIAPNAAVFSCLVSNSGETDATGLQYAAGSGVSVGAGPASCAANTASCGATVVTSGTTAGTYAGTLTVTPTQGSAGSQGYSLVVSVPQRFTVDSPVVFSGSNTVVRYTYHNPNPNAQPISGVSVTASVAGEGPAIDAASTCKSGVSVPGGGGTCTLIIDADQDCMRMISYSVTGHLTMLAGTVDGAAAGIAKPTTPCNLRGPFDGGPGGKPTGAAVPAGQVKSAE